MQLHRSASMGSRGMPAMLFVFLVFVPNTRQESLESSGVVVHRLKTKELALW